ncbi:MAG: Trk system potassium transport protein TrkA [Treponema sp.]|jgi:trk system potassium uptake protein TrkA|nr:Trk system potassium transport protein TrkA [Treponema sp.]
MRIVIVGAGMVGAQVAKHLIQEKHDVSIIESNEERARHASNRIDCMVIHDEGNSIKALEEAGITKADALVCVTDSDEVNMIICGLAASRYGKNNGLLKIARVRNDDYMHLSRAGDKQVLGIDHFIHPNIEACRSIIKAIEHGAMGHVISFSNTPYELGSIDVAEGSAFDGLALKDYRNLVVAESLVTLLERGEEVLLPSGATVLAKGDRVYILANGKDLPAIFRFAGETEKPIHKIGIVGGGRLGSLLAEGLLGKNGFSGTVQQAERRREKHNFLFPLIKAFSPRSSRRIVIIEQDYRLCKELAARFPEALVLNEDISDESFVNEEQLDDLDLLVTTTNNQELNIITAVYLKSRGIDRTIAIVTGSGYAAMAGHLGVDVVIPMKSVVVDSILSHLMGSGIKEIHRIGDGSVDIIEIEIAKDAPVVDKLISEFKLSAGGLLMLVNRGGNSFIPSGGYVFSEGDRIVLIAKTGSQTEIEKYFGAAL